MRWTWNCRTYKEPQAGFRLGEPALLSLSFAKFLGETLHSAYKSTFTHLPSLFASRCGQQARVWQRCQQAG